MTLETENYMDQFSGPEEFIRREVLANRGTQNIIDKSDLLYMVASNPEVQDRNLEELSKAELFDFLIELEGADACTKFAVGVSSHSWQLKFGIEHKDVLKMAKKGFIATTGEQRFWAFGRYCYAKTYSPYDYFRLTTEEVHAWLAANPRKKRNTKQARLRREERQKEEERKQEIARLEHQAKIDKEKRKEEEQFLRLLDDKESILCFDLETTGFDSVNDEILQIAIIDGAGKVLFNEYIRPTHTTEWPEAEAVNCISPDRVSGCPTIDEYLPVLNEIFSRAKLIVGYNALNFDIFFLTASGVMIPEDARFYDVMLEFAPIYGEWNDFLHDYRWQKLKVCADYYGYQRNGLFHDGLEDTRATLHSFWAMVADGQREGEKRQDD